MKIRRLTPFFILLDSSFCFPAVAKRLCSRKAATPVRVSAVERYTPGQGQRYSASILPNRQVNLAFRASGFVESIYQVRGADGRMRSVDIGDIVKAGTVLAQVRLKDYQLQVSQAEGQVKQATQAGQTAGAQLAQAEAAAAKAKQDFDRADALFKKTSLTKSDYDAAKANRDSTRAQVEAARSQVQGSTGALSAAQGALGTATLALNDTSLIAPFTGAVVQRSVDVGTLAGPSMVAFVLADVSSVKAAFGVSDILVAHLKNGSKLSIYTEAFPNRQFQGFVSAIGAVADSSTRAFQVEVTIRNEHAMLRPGMIASLDVGEQPRLQAATDCALGCHCSRLRRLISIRSSGGRQRSRPAKTRNSRPDLRRSDRHHRCRSRPEDCKLRRKLRV